MITLKTGDLLDSDAQTLVNTVNCVGVMGKGIALDFKLKYPAMFKDYVQRCKKEELVIGEPYIFRQLLGPWIVNFPTKTHWRARSRLEDVAQGLDYLDRHLAMWGVDSIAVPPLGCGNGQLKWRDVGPLIVQYLGHHDIEIQLYTPPDAPLSQLTPEFLGISGPR